ncbi:hypothetical protein BpHYR1_035867 [Brachionus plicatilis]|uniref:Uncharacterized protein n=1 Tax=Brachionus plicatilis TaxID=10195 RepID=A0A3M7PCW8_BRAPC|nr:hypothetical protein BpHYR1_035867 [Brachionus plicatilis]
MMLDQSQQMRKGDMERNQILQNRLDMLEKISNSEPNSALSNQFELVNQITKFQASESILKQSLENEKLKINELNDQIFELKRTLHHSMSSFENTLENSSHKNNDKLYSEILENLKSQGLSQETSNYREIIIHLYKQKMNALRQLKDFTFYIQEINPDIGQDPLDAMKLLFTEMKSYQHEIQQLKQKIELNKLEMRVQQDEYRRQIFSLNDELNKKPENKINFMIREKIEDSAIEEDTLSQNIPIYTSTAEFVTSRTITIPSHDNSSFYAVDTENIENISVNRCKSELKKVEKAEKETQIDGELMKNLKKDKELRLKYENLTEQLDKIKAEKCTADQKLISLLSELKQLQNENYNLANKQETQIQLLNEQINSFQEETVRLKNENNQLRLQQTRNNSELTQLIENYEDKINQCNSQVNKVKNDMEVLRIENDKLQQRCDELSETINKNLNESIKRSAECNSEISNYTLELSKIKLENENYKNENEKLINEMHSLKQEHANSNEELKRKIIVYENEISLMNKDIKKLEIELNSSRLDYRVKCDEIDRLQRSLVELDDLKEKYSDTEHKLNYQIKSSQHVQDKLHQLQNELISKGFANDANFISNSTDSNYENIIDNLKYIIHEHLNLRNLSTQNEIEELRLKIKKQYYFNAKRK